MKFNEIKSAEVIDTQTDVQAFLRSLAEEVNSSNNTDTKVVERSSGELSVAKSTGLSSRASAPEVEELKEMAEASGLPWQDDYAERVIPWWASDQRVDRHGDIVEQSWDFGTFDNNPVVLYGHNWDAPPIGNVIHKEVRMRRDSGYSGPSLRLMPLFATKEQYPAADTIFRLAKSRFLRSGSVGFLPGKVLQVKDDTERKELGLGKNGVIYRDNSLVEGTITSIPANTGAHQVLASAKKSGMLESGDVNFIRELKRRECLRDTDPEKAWREIDNVICTLWYSLYPEVRLSNHEQIEDPVLADESFSGKAMVTGVDMTDKEATKQEDPGTMVQISGDEPDETEVKESDVATLIQLSAASVTRQDALIDRIDKLTAVMEDIRFNLEMKNNSDLQVAESNETTVLSNALEKCLEISESWHGQNQTSSIDEE